MFHLKIDKNQLQEPTSKKIRFGTSFLPFFLDFGLPLGVPNFLKKVKNGVQALAPTLFFSNLGSLGLLFRKNIDFYPPWTPILVTFLVIFW